MKRWLLTVVTGLQPLIIVLLVNADFGQQPLLGWYVAIVGGIGLGAFIYFAPWWDDKW